MSYHTRGFLIISRKNLSSSYFPWSSDRKSIPSMLLAICETKSFENRARCSVGMIREVKILKYRFIILCTEITRRGAWRVFPVVQTRVVPLAVSDVDLCAELEHWQCGGNPRPTSLELSALNECPPEYVKQAWKESLSWAEKLHVSEKGTSHSLGKGFLSRTGGID
ncbi:hypothetical protein OBBRIDRAFT_277567 [Obba rivulosa]|uniref:Uncharacterized protein n=1 Tax=Obba rivulosa TaxID=1052685 RepID=A0A8E2J346_9APHY|nr:hypothetical protein OBBRIDRAFT_277567 [Obba rivulosa]